MRATPPIETIVRTIVDGAHPRRVVLFGSHARGEAGPDSDVDLMVEMDTQLTRFERRRQIEQLFPKRPVAMDLLVCTPEEFAANRDDPGTILYAIAREGKVLYCSPDAMRPTQPDRVLERPLEPPSIASWISDAAVDLSAIDGLVRMEEVPWPAVCFHAQQAAEKLLKALLIRRWLRPDRSHNLTELLETCRLAGDALAELDTDCALLSTYAVDSRYSWRGFDAEPPAQISNETGREAVAAMHRIAAAARALLGPR